MPTMIRKLLFVVSLIFLSSITYNSFLIAQGGSGTISGLVVDALSGEPLIGTNVAIQGTSLGTFSDLNGE